MTSYRRPENKLIRIIVAVVDATRCRVLECSLVFPTVRNAESEDISASTALQGRWIQGMEMAFIWDLFVSSNCLLEFSCLVLLQLHAA